MKLANRSLYLQARDVISNLIEEKFQPMQKIPSEHKLSGMLGVSRNTIREAIRTLEQEGVLYSRHGIGTFVVGSKQSLITNISTLESSTKIITDQGYEPGTKNVIYDVRKCPDHLLRHLEIEDSNEQVFYIERVRTADGEPVVYVEDYIPYVSGMDEKYTKDHGESLLEFLQSYGWSVAFSVCTIKAVISNKKVE
ncbi:GntR family transcriptional regulator [Terrilactibacillus laevilacticus]|nr:GntR family transcriptional regulator [Terrilactibacillus laevilacticus]